MRGNHVTCRTRGFREIKVNACLELGFSVREASHAIRVSVHAACRWRSQNFPLTRKKVSGRLRKTSSRTDHLIVRLVRADSTVTLTELARVMLFFFFQRFDDGYCVESNFRSVKRPDVVELTDGFTTVIRDGPHVVSMLPHVGKALTSLNSFCLHNTMAFHDTKCKFRR